MSYPSSAEEAAPLLREIYRDAFKESVAAGTAIPLVMPYTLLGAFIIPTLWLAVPHTGQGRSWVYSTRWLVMLFVYTSCGDVVLRASSTNMAFSYATGLMAAWGIVNNTNLIVWKRPQAESARIVRRRTAGHVLKTEGRCEDATNGVAVKGGSVDGGVGDFDRLNGARRRRADIVPSAESTDDTGQTSRAADSDFVWEPFPVEAPFSYRLNWALDLVCSFRGTGWSHSISSLPRPKQDAGLGQGTPVDLDSIPTVSPGGYRRCATRSQIISTRLQTVFVCYVILDFLSVYMMKDPYFVFGPDHSAYTHQLSSLPAYLDNVHPRLIKVYRQLFGSAAIVCAIEGMFSLADFAQLYLASSIWPRCAEPWSYPTTYGSLTTILDRGLPGWWGGWWHQTFRMQFLAPSTFLLSRGYVTKNSLPGVVVALLAAFGQSGFLHACGSITSIPETKVWRAPAFFLLQALGIIVQDALSRLVGRCITLPRPLRQMGNLLSTLAWLHMTADVLLGDLASTGLWLLEPVPFSLFRGLGLGGAEDDWLRWGDRDIWPSWYRGRYWWESGVGF